MHSENRLGEFLRARRERTKPGDIGLREFGRRRVSGLRREEVAMLAGVSSDYYVRLEQGREIRPSQQVLEALARALGMDDEAAAHLHRLARPAPRHRQAASSVEQVHPNLLRLMEVWAHTPALVLGRYLDVLDANTLGSALYGGFSGERNMLRLLFLDPTAREFHLDWEWAAEASVAALRAEADLADPTLTELVGELSLHSDEFGRMWARHEVRRKTHRTRRFLHPMVGEITLIYESFTVNSAPGQQFVVYQADAGSDSDYALKLLGGLSADDPIAEHTEQEQN
jgi:transcriptional regulator with XRE-family HTH domain